MKFEWSDRKNYLNLEKQTKKKGVFMSNIKHREKFDDYDMQDEYDFTNAVRGRFY